MKKIKTISFLKRMAQIGTKENPLPVNPSRPESRHHIIENWNADRVLQYIPVSPALKTKLQGLTPKYIQNTDFWTLLSPQEKYEINQGVNQVFQRSSGNRSHGYATDEYTGTGSY